MLHSNRLLIQRSPLSVSILRGLSINLLPKPSYDHLSVLFFPNPPFFDHLAEPFISVQESMHICASGHLSGHTKWTIKCIAHLHHTLLNGAVIFQQSIPRRCQHRCRLRLYVWIGVEESTQVRVGVRGI